MNSKLFRYGTACMMTSAIVFSVTYPSGRANAQSLFNAQSGGTGQSSSNSLGSFMTSPPSGSASTSVPQLSAFSSTSSGSGSSGSSMSGGSGASSSNMGSSTPNTSTPGTIVTPQPAVATGPTPADYGSPLAPGAIGATQPPAPTLNAAIQSTSQLLPFGANLFLNATPPSSLAPNPGYVIQPGDTVEIQLYGG